MVNDTKSLPSLDQANPIFLNRIPCEWLKTEQAALYLGVTPNALRICVHRGQVPVYHFGRRLRFRLADLRATPLKKGA